MKMKEVRMTMSEELWKKYKHVCVDMNLSLTKQTVALIKHFVDVQEENQKRIKGEK